jgi:hypothetical protein
MRSRFALFATALALATPAAAQDRPPQGIGFAQAEEGTWLCRNESPAEALSCARELCSEQASGQECYPTAWCYPANWSGLMVIWLGDFHATHALCGAPNEAALTAALGALCAGNEGATNCDLFKVIDPDGNEREVQGISFPGPAAVADPAPALPRATGEPVTEAPAAVPDLPEPQPSGP